ncbi:MAG: sulfotransferase [Gammaproteobacteria bacterium]|nr:sulfotransferase [Gammaproteobacteria bacterium]
MTWTDQNIVFLISLPRSGSTLLQRILAAHPDVHTSPESWLLLPQLYAMRQGSVFSEYAHTTAAAAISEFCSHLEGGEDAYYRRVGELAVRLFADVSPPERRYYLEKTPRNNLVLDELLRAFPQSRIIFLWRNPLACAASIIETFGKGRWNLFKSAVDLYDGLDNMTCAARDYPDRIKAIQYESLLKAPDETIDELLAYLDLPVAEQLSEQFASIQLAGRMGDPSGTREYSSLSQAPLEKWKETFAGMARQRWARRYLEWIGPERLEVMRYSHADLETELESIPTRWAGTGSDLALMGYGYLERNLQLKFARYLVRTRKQKRVRRRYF